MKIGLIGRTNVGKSTLFNRLIGQHRLIVTEIAGTTREIISEEIKFDDLHSGTIYDSPGLDSFDKEKHFIKRIIEESDLLLFVVDGKLGLGSQDDEIKSLVFSMGAIKKTILVVNKLDGKTFGANLDRALSDFHNFGFSNIVGISADKRENFEALLELIHEKIIQLKLEYDTPSTNDFIPLAIVGRPNVGKSTLINKLAQGDISQVSDKDGTTLDYLTADMKYKGKKYKLYDTAGIRKRGKIHGLERIAYDKMVSMIEFVKPVTLVLIDITEGIVHRDLSLIGDIIKLNVPMMVAINKIDTISPEEFEKMSKQIQHHFKFAKWLPIVSISGKDGIRLPEMMDFVSKLWNEYNKKVGTSQLNEVLSRQWMTTPPRFPKNKVCKFYYLTQIESNPPKFKAFINKLDNANFSFVKWIENTIRMSFGFVGVPIVIDFAERAEKTKRKTKAQKQKEQDALMWQEKKEKLEAKKAQRLERQTLRDEKNKEKTQRRKSKYND